MPAAVILWQDCDPDPVGGECLSCKEKELFVTVFGFTEQVISNDVRWQNAFFYKCWYY
jgi:hypothetical protein